MTMGIAPQSWGWWPVKFKFLGVSGWRFQYCHPLVGRLWRGYVTLDVRVLWESGSIAGWMTVDSHEPRWALLPHLEMGTGQQAHEYVGGS